MQSLSPNVTQWCMRLTIIIDYSLIVPGGAVVRVLHCKSSSYGFESHSAVLVGIALQPYVPAVVSNEV